MISTFSDSVDRGTEAVHRAELVRSLRKTLDLEFQSAFRENENQIQENAGSGNRDQRNFESSGISSSSDSQEGPLDLIGTPLSIEFTTHVLPIDDLFEEVETRLESENDFSFTESDNQVRFAELRRIRYEFAVDENGQKVLALVRRELTWSAAQVLLQKQSTSREESVGIFPKINVETELAKEFGNIIISTTPDSSDSSSGKNDDTNVFGSGALGSEDSLNSDPNDAKSLLAMPKEDRITAIKRLQFRYFDGSSWVTSWDSNEMKGLPVAIEMVFDMWRRNERVEFMQKSGLSSGTIDLATTDGDENPNSVLPLTIDTDEIDLDWSPQHRLLFYLPQTSLDRSSASQNLSIEEELFQ